MEHFKCWRSRLQYNTCLREVEDINVSAPGCNTIHVSGRWSTLNIGILSCNTKCVSRQRELQGATYNVPADAGIQIWNKEHLQAGDHSVLNVCDSFNAFDISVSIRRMSDPSVTSSHTTLQSQGTHTFFTQMGQYLKNAITRKLALYKYALYLLTMTNNTFTEQTGFILCLGYAPEKHCTNQT